MDPTLLGVIIGSLLSFFGNFINHWFIDQKDEKQWERKRLIERENRVREERKEKWNIYNNCTSSLSLLVATEFNPEAVQVTDEERLDLYRDANKWLSLFALHLHEGVDHKKRSDFFSELRVFTEMYDKFLARSLRIMVIELAMSDQEFFQASNQRTDKPNEILVKINIDNKFRRMMFIDGVELPSIHEFSINLDDLSPTQREKLWDIFCETHNEIPDVIELPLPKYNKGSKKVSLRGRSWSGQINPFDLSPKEVINQWEQDFDKALIAVSNECNELI